MYDIEGSMDRQILQISKTRPTVVFVEPKDPRIIEAACQLTRFIRPVLLASEAEIREVAARELGHLDPNRIEYGLSECAFIDILANPQLVEEFAKGYLEFQAGTGETLGLDEAMRLVSDPVLFGICAVEVRPRRYRGRRRGPQRPELFPPHDADARQAGVPLRGGRLRAARRPAGGDLPPEHRGLRRRGRERRHDAGNPGPDRGGDLRHRPGHLSRGRAARDPRSHHLLLRLGLRRRPVPDAGARGHGAGAQVPRGAHPEGGALQVHQDPGRGEDQRRPLPALGHVLPLPPGELARFPQRGHLPEPGHGQPALPPLRRALPQRQEVPRVLRAALRRGGPGHGLQPRGHPPGREGLRPAHAQVRRVDPDSEGHLLPPLPRPGHQPGLHLHQALHLRRGAGAHHQGAPALGRGAEALRGPVHHRSVPVPEGRHREVPARERPHHGRHRRGFGAAAACSGPCLTAPIR